VVVDLKPLKKLPSPVSLATIKADERLQGMQLVRLGRLSVSGVTEEEFQLISNLGGL